MAYLALRVVRVMLELPKEIISRASNYEGDDEIVHYSLVADTEHDEDAGLKEMAKEKELATALSDHGGFLTAGLETSDYSKRYYICFLVKFYSCRCRLLNNFVELYCIPGRICYTDKTNTIR